MHTPETQQKFIELRAQGWSYDQISNQIGVARSTLIQWSHKFRFELNNQRALAMDALQNRVMGTCEARVTALAEKLSRVEEELSKRDLSTVPTSRLYSMAAALRREIQRETADVSFATPVDGIPQDEYFEQVQEWRP